MVRKFTLMALLLCIAFCAEAQIYIGGNIGLSTSSSGNDSRIGIVIAPEIGYDISPNFTVGANISYRSLKNSFGISPYLRGYLLNIQDRFRLFMAFQAPFNFSNGYQSYGAFLRPGMTFRVADGVWMMAHIGAFGYSYTKDRGVGGGKWSARVNSNTISIGFCFSIRP